MRRNQLVFWLSVACAVPFAYASSYAVNGAPPAEGCSGAGSGSGTGSEEEAEGVLRLWTIDDAPTVSADQAAFVFGATTNKTNHDAVLAAIQVTVRDERGAEVPGNVWVLKAEGSSDGPQTLTLSWQWHGEPRPDGEVLSLHASATNTVGTTEIDATLTVKAGPYQGIRAPIVTLSDFDEVVRDVGVLAQCEGVSECGTTTTWFGKELATRTRMEVVMSVAYPDVMVAWEFQLQQLSGKGEFLDKGRRIEAFEAVPDYVEQLEFADVVDEYCFRIQGRDLRTSEIDSVDFCASPSRPLDTLSLDSIGKCTEPPPGQHERWCLAPDPEELRTPAQTAECERLLTGEGGSGGEGPSPPSTSGSGGNPNGGNGGRGPSAAGTGGDRPQTGGAPSAGTGATEPPDAEAGSAGEDPASEGSTQRIVTDGGCGCRTAPHDDRGGAYGGLLALLGVFALRRRRVA